MKSQSSFLTGFLYIDRQVDDDGILKTLFFDHPLRLQMPVMRVN